MSLCFVVFFAIGPGMFILLSDKVVHFCYQIRQVHSYPTRQFILLSDQVSSFLSDKVVHFPIESSMFILLSDKVVIGLGRFILNLLSINVGSYCFQIRYVHFAIQQSWFILLSDQVDSICYRTRQVHFTIGLGKALVLLSDQIGQFCYRTRQLYFVIFIFLKLRDVRMGVIFRQCLFINLVGIKV